jgi:hypothetical protein
MRLNIVFFLNFKQSHNTVFCQYIIQEKIFKYISLTKKIMEYGKYLIYTDVEFHNILEF